MLLETHTLDAYATQDEDGNIIAYLSKDEDAEHFFVNTRKQAADFINAAHRDGIKHIEWDPTEEQPDIESGIYTIDDWINELGYHNKISTNSIGYDEDVTPIFVIKVYEGDDAEPFIRWELTDRDNESSFDGNVKGLIEKLKAYGFKVVFLNKFEEFNISFLLLYDPKHWRPLNRVDTHTDYVVYKSHRATGSDTFMFEPRTNAAKELMNAYVLDKGSDYEQERAFFLMVRNWFESNQEWGSRFIRDLYD